MNKSIYMYAFFSTLSYSMNLNREIFHLFVHFMLIHPNNIPQRNIRLFTVVIQNLRILQTE